MRHRPDSSALTGNFFSPVRPRFFAHRGLALEVPENSMLAFVKALSVGVDYIETDVHVSQDGVAVISHDPDLSRVVGRDVRVDQLTMFELARTQLGADQSFVSLVEVLDAFPDARFNIDIKTDGAVAPTVDAVLGAGAADRVLIASFSARRRRAAVRQLPGVATSASRAASAAAVLAAAIGSVALTRWVLRDVHAVQLPERIGRLRIMTRPVVRRLRSAGVEVHVWTINDKETMRSLIELGVDGIVTDRSDLAVELLTNGDLSAPSI